MSSGVNKVILLGTLGADPDLSYTPNGNAVCNMRAATNERWTDKSGQKQERTEWHRITAWGKTAENCAKYLSKGRQVYVEGKLQTRSWDDKDGNKRYTTEIVAQHVQFIGGKSDSNSNQGGGYDDGPPPPDDDIPFARVLSPLADSAAHEPGRMAVKL